MPKAYSDAPGTWCGLTSLVKSSCGVLTQRVCCLRFFYVVVVSLICSAPIIYRASSPSPAPASAPTGIRASLARSGWFFWALFWHLQLFFHKFQIRNFIPLVKPRISLDSIQLSHPFLSNLQQRNNLFQQQPPHHTTPQQFDGHNATSTSRLSFNSKSHMFSSKHFSSIITLALWHRKVTHRYPAVRTGFLTPESLFIDLRPLMDSRFLHTLPPSYSPLPFPSRGYFINTTAFIPSINDHHVSMVVQLSAPSQHVALGFDGQ